KAPVRRSDPAAPGESDAVGRHRPAPVEMARTALPIAPAARWSAQVSLLCGCFPDLNAGPRSPPGNPWASGVLRPRSLARRLPKRPERRPQRESVQDQRKVFLHRSSS
ncbi:MAG TPA: hypothetical protein VED37_12560, partial [Ktedonobacteraceae bacterium]|nr:hypothetical protein [Ktedonobacteraceae bacterium]